MSEARDLRIANGTISAIVLAGGRSSRFGSDKLAAVVGDGTLLDAAVGGASSIAGDIVVVVAPGGAGRQVGDRSVKIVEDPEPFGGPLIGLLAGLAAVAHPMVVVVGGDMPTLGGAVLRLMVGTLGADGAVAAVVLGREGRPQPLPAVIRTGAAIDAGRRLMADGERSLRSLFDELATRVLGEEEWRPLDPDGRTLHDVDTPADLEP